MASTSQADMIAQQFVHHYYQKFDTDRSQLQSLYTPASVMCFEGSVCQGNEQIGKKLVSLPFQKVAHVVTVMDSLLIEESKLLISVIGQLKTDDDPPHGFAQTFILAPVGDNLMVFHDIFRLLVHNM
ncbi:nuclear transport factor 2-like isoform X3 [Lytechinus variegatus]|uniref:nuclear transport factor 2-like isoform X3 n=1 Tax=Lytechinus variegatus TaxID=7654 RepID=UPI001BB1F11B|nr:nuclear transport factor 2-like isoform X3 [Lytechinus variegatus]